MTQPDVQATLQARFVDDDTLVRTGRALLEVNGHGWVVVPVPAGWAEQIEAVLDAAVEADTISVFVDAAEAAATAASGHAQVAFDEADRSASEADRAEAAAQSAATGVQPDTVGRLHLTPGLRGEIDGKAPVSHDHALTEVTGLAEALETAGGPPVIVSTTPPEDTDAIWVNPDEVPPASGPGGGPTAWGDIQDKPVTYPPGPHSHSQSEVEGLEDALAGKASTDHTHTPASIGAAPASHTHTAAQISDATTVGRNVLKATDAAAARSAIGAGTSNLAIGTTSSTAAAGNHTHTPASIGAAPASHTHSEYATTSQVEARAPEIRVVSTIPTSPTPGVVYLRFG